MNSLVKYDIEARPALDADLETLLVYVSRFGKPRLSRMSRGWFATIEMNTNQEGSTFKIESNMDHKTPTIAAMVMVERMHKSLETLTSKHTG